MFRLRRSNWIFFALICLSAVALFHCGPGKQELTRNSTVVFLYPADEWCFSPCTSMEPQHLVFDSLFSGDADGELTGDLASHWDHSSDFRSWTIRIDKNARWHDGRPVTSGDILFTLNMMSNPDSYLLKPQNYDLTIIDEKSFRLTFKNRSSYIPQDTWNVYYPKHLLENQTDGNYCSWDFWTHPVGSGPYRYVRHIPQTMVELEANPTYHKGPPGIKRVIIKFSRSVLTELLSGDAHIALSVSDMDRLKIEKDSRFVVYSELGSVHEVIIWNQNLRIFRDGRVRRAIAHAIDRRELHNLLDLPAEIPVFDWPFSKGQYQRGDLSKPLDCDPEISRRLLNEAGWRDSNNNGVVEKDNDEFRFTVLTAKANEPEAVFVQDQLRRVGIAMQIQVVDGSLLRQRLMAGDFEASLVQMGPVSALHLFGEYSPIDYSNAELVDLFTAKRNALDLDTEETVNRKIWKFLEDDQPVTFLCPIVISHVAHRRIKGLVDVTGANPLLNITKLWIDEN